MVTPKGPRVVVDNEFATLVYHARSRIVHQLQVLTKGVELLEQRGACKWLSDDRGNSALHPGDAVWSMGVWTVRAMAAGWKYWAVVMPDAALGRANMRRFLKQHIDQGLRIRVFEEPEAALGWLEAPESADNRSTADDA